MIILKALWLFLACSILMALILAVPYGVYLLLGQTPDAAGMALAIAGVALFSMLAQFFPDWWR